MAERDIREGVLGIQDGDAQTLFWTRAVKKLQDVVGRVCDMSKDRLIFAIRSFLRALRFVRGGGGTTLAEGELEPIEALPRADGLSDFEGAGREALARTVVLKLNGGLGTSMGLAGPKSLLPVRGDRRQDLPRHQRRRGAD